MKGQHEILNWELHILSRAISFSNLSTASPHVGLSPSQLSRLITKLEERFQLKLLDRDTKRKSAWLPSAKKLVEIYRNASKNFELGITGLAENLDPDHISIACLDGLIEMAVNLSKELYENSRIRLIEIKAMDLGLLEESFLNGEIDFAFTSKTPGMKKLKHVKTLGYQSIDLFEVESKLQQTSTTTSKQKTYETISVLSPFEYHARRQKFAEDQRLIIASHLFARKFWVESFGGRMTLPSKVYKQRKNIGTERPVMLIGQELLPEKIWNLAKNLF